MAKNLKLNIKNAQLAEALNLKKLQKPASKKEQKKAEEEAPVAEKAAPQPETVETPAAVQPPVEAPEVTQPPKQVEAEAVQAPEAAPAAPPKAAEPPPKRYAPGYPQRPSEERPYPPRQQYPRGPSAPTQRPAPREGYQREGYQREGYQPREQRPPYQRPAAGAEGAPPRREYNRPGFPQGRPSPRPPYQPRQESGFRNTIPLPSTKEGEKPEKKPEKTFTRGFKEESDFEAKKGAGVKEFKDFKPSKKQESWVFDSRDRQGLRDTESEVWRKRKAAKTKAVAEEIAVRPKNLKIKLPITVKDLAVEMKLKASELISKLFMQGVIITLNDYLDDETTVQLLGHEFGCEIEIDTTEEKRIRITDETIKQEVEKTPADQLSLRPPIITFMGHVDHGKTSLIDTIRKSNVAASEAGAITQHIGAFRCHTAVGDITVLDTPGHEAFSAMRSRGADVTDIVVLVIAGDEGIKTQTVEAIQQATAAKVPIVVALNKCDKPGFDAENIYRQLADHNLLPESWGGTTITVKCSALTGVGIKELLEMLALQAEILELKANSNTRARGTVIESQLHKGLGSVATVLVMNGTLHLGDAVVFDQLWGRVKTMHDQNGKEMQDAGPSTPVKITGLSGLPEAGSDFIVVKNEKEARELSYARIEGRKKVIALQAKKGGIDLLQQKAETQAKKILNLVLRADVQGSLEALRTSLMKVFSNKVEINVISTGVGEISESDIQLAAASKATIIGFHTQVESHAEDLIKQTKVIVKLHDIIYHAIDDVKVLMKSLLDKIPQENDTGSALVKTTFKASQLGVIAGCQVSEGTIKRSNMIRVVRDNEVVWKGAIASLKRVKEDVREVSKGYECGILLQNNNDVKEGDILQAYEITYLEQEL